MHLKHLPNNNKELVVWGIHFLENLWVIEFLDQCRKIIVPYQTVVPFPRLCQRFLFAFILYLWNDDHHQVTTYHIILTYHYLFWWGDWIFITIIIKFFYILQLMILIYFLYKLSLYLLNNQSVYLFYYHSPLYNPI